MRINLPGLMRWLLPALFLSLATGPGAETRQSFVALGDTPYGDPVKVFPRYERLIGNINNANPALVIHVGDLHGRYTCDDDLLAQLLVYLNSFTAPVLYTPGDNEWTDCANTRSGLVFDPLERLDHIRETYFAMPARTLGGKRLARRSQAARGYPENGRLMLGDVAFITLHVVGSNNNYDPSSPANTAEFRRRNAANAAWLTESFAAFPEARAYVVALHADIFLHAAGFRNGWTKASPFLDTGVALSTLSHEVKKPVLILYGDSHVHKQFQPFPHRRPYLHAIQVYGHPAMRAIEIEVAPDAILPFRVIREFRP